ncbi:hypothetical protein NTGM5_610001 [Candidatus Nitrotoga sp. M5]|nr:hypothetical protein NTGM5_610001 [Candidatus Nitrotoga sp. M5]
MAQHLEDVTILRLCMHVRLLKVYEIKIHLLMQISIYLIKHYETNTLN